MKGTKKGTKTKVRGRNGGFTLVELLVVMATLAILAGVVFPQVTGITQTGRGSVKTNDIHIAEEGVERFVADNPAGRQKGWPTRDDAAVEDTSVKGALPLGSDFYALDWFAKFSDPQDPTNPDKVFSKEYMRELPRNPFTVKNLAGVVTVGKTFVDANGDGIDDFTGWPKFAVWRLNSSGRVEVNLDNDQY